MLSVALTITRDQRARGAITIIHQKPYENALNTALKQAREGEYDYLITFDHDNVPTKNPIDLISLDKDIIGMPYPTYRYNSQGEIEFALLAMDKQSNGEYLDHKDRNGLQEVDAIASGAIMISKRVFTTDLYFSREWKDGFAIRGIDFNFCDKAKQKGFHIFAHYDYPSNHYKEINLLDL